MIESRGEYDADPAKAEKGSSQVYVDVVTETSLDDPDSKPITNPKPQADEELHYVAGADTPETILEPHPEDLPVANDNPLDKEKPATEVKQVGDKQPDPEDSPKPDENLEKIKTELNSIATSIKSLVETILGLVPKEHGILTQDSDTVRNNYNALVEKYNGLLDKLDQILNPLEKSIAAVADNSSLTHQISDIRALANPIDSLLDKYEARAARFQEIFTHQARFDSNYSIIDEMDEVALRQELVTHRSFDADAKVMGGLGSSNHENITKALQVQLRVIGEINDALKAGEFGSYAQAKSILEKYQNSRVYSALKEKIKERIEELIKLQDLEFDNASLKAIELDLLSMLVTNSLNELEVSINMGNSEYRVDRKGRDLLAVAYKDLLELDSRVSRLEKLSHGVQPTDTSEYASQVSSLLVKAKLLQRRLTAVVSYAEGNPRATREIV